MEFTKKANLVEVEHVKVLGSKKEKNMCRFFEKKKKTAESNEKADKQAKDGAMMDGEVMAQIRAITSH